MKQQNKKYNIVIADPQFLISFSLKSIIDESDEYAIVGLAENIEELHSLLKSAAVDLLITDFNLIDYNKFLSLGAILTEYPLLHVLILTNHINRNDLNELAKLGVRNVIYKTTDYESIFIALESAIRNRNHFSAEVLDVLMDKNTSHQVSQESNYLTPSEIEIVKLIASGLTTKEIAQQKFISFHTVMSHRKNIFRKLNINNSSELLMYAIRAGLIDNIEYYL